MSAHNIEAEFILMGSELVKLGPRGFRRMVRESGVDVVAVHSRAWRRQVCPQVFIAALALAPVGRCLIIDDEAPDSRSVHEVDARWSVAGTATEVVSGLLGASWEIGRHKFRARRAGPYSPIGFSGKGVKTSPWILVIWRSFDLVVGGAVTHLSGILKSFRKTGLKVALLTTSEPLPDEILAVADLVRSAPPVPPGARLTTEIERLGINRQMRVLGKAWCRELNPQFIYQRHGLLLDAGAEISLACRVPLVLEWNASEVWAHEHWGSSSSSGRGVEPVMRPIRHSMERHAVTNAGLILAVSRHAAKMAYDAGAPHSRVLHLPNGVDLEEVRPCTASRPNDGALWIGWIGSFGSWHGGSIIVEALAHLPPDMHLVMIGDGAERQACQALGRSLGVEERIEWAGRLPHGAALERLRACDVLVSPHVPLTGTPFFGSPTKIFEYMALGKPIVASRLEQLEEVLEDRRTARLVTPGVAEELADAIQELLQSRDQGRQLGLAALAEAEAKHSWDRRVKLILEHVGPARVPRDELSNETD